MEKHNHFPFLNSLAIKHNHKTVNKNKFDYNDYFIQFVVVTNTMSGILKFFKNFFKK